MRSNVKPLLRVLICIGAVAAIAAPLLALHTAPTTAAMILLIAVLFASTAWGLPYALLLSASAGFALSFFLEPYGSPQIADPRDWIAEVTFLITGITASHLASRARRQTIQANQRRNEAVAAQQRFTDLVNSIEGIVWEADAKTFQFSFVSQQAERILGYPVERWLSEPTFWKDHLHPDDRNWAVDFCVKATLEKRAHDFEYRMIAADGRVVWLRDIVTVVVEREQATSLRGVMVDITARQALRQAQAELARMSQVITVGEMTASLAHEINQPISAALTNATTCMRWLARESPDLEEARQAVWRMQKDVTRASEIVSRVRSLFTKGAPRRESLEVNEVIREMIPLMRSEAGQCSVSLSTQLDSDLPRVMVDRVQLQQVIMNLALNGMDAMREVHRTRELTIKSARDGAELVLSVSDTGVGLPSGEADRIFKAFFTTKPQGMGMGLAISRSIIESHGGRLWAAANEGPGTTFYFTLPTQAAESSRVAGIAPA